MKTIRINDKWDNWKVWIIKVYNRGEVYFNQECHGTMTNYKFVRTTKKYLKEYLKIDVNEEFYKDEYSRSKEELNYRDRFISKCRAIEESILNESLPF